MSRYLSTNRLIESVRNRAMLPSTQQTFQEADFLMFANEEMDNSVVPFIHSFRQDYLLGSTDVPFEQNVLRYKIPERAIASKLRDVSIKDSAGNVYEMTRIFIEDEPYFQYNYAGAGMNGFRCFYTEADEIVFPEGTSLFGPISFKMSYYIRPNQLVSESRVARVVNVDKNTNTITIDNFPTVFGGATKFDITSCKSPYTLVAMDIEPTVLPNSNSLTMTFETLPRYISKGDVVSLPEETIIPQIPVELHSLLAQRVAMRCLEALGDTQGLSNATAKLQEMEAKLGGVLSDRVEGAPQKVNNLHSNLRASRRWTRGW